MSNIETSEHPTELQFDTVNAHKRIICKACQKKFFSDRTDPKALIEDLGKKLLLHLQNSHKALLEQHNKSIQQVMEACAQHFFLDAFAITEHNTLLQEYQDNVLQLLLEALEVDIVDDEIDTVDDIPDEDQSDYTDEEKERAKGDFFVS